jgi:hypothetical protein
MSTTTQLKELKLTDDERLLRKYNILDTEGNLTEEGARVTRDYAFTEHKTAILADLKTLDAKATKTTKA